MSLIKCKECGKEISDKAKTCVHCGASIHEEKKYCPECGKIMKDNKCSYCGKEINNSESEVINNNAEENNNPNIPNGGGSSLASSIIKTIVLGLLMWGGFNYFVYGDIFGAFGGKGKIIDTTWNTGYGKLTFFKSGKCELISVLPSDTCTWKLDGKDVTIKYSFGNTKGTINGKFNENYSRFTYK